MISARSTRRTALLLALATLAAGAPSSASAVDLLSCLRSLVSGSSLEQIPKVRPRRQCELPNCWALSSLTQVEQVSRAQAPAAAEALAYRQLQMDAMHALLGRDTEALRNGLKKGGDLRLFLELQSRFGLPAESEWKPRTSLNATPGAYRSLALQLEARIQRYHSERSPEATPEASQALFDAAFSDVMKIIETSAGGPLPVRARLDLSGVSPGSSTPVFQVVLRPSGLPSDPVQNLSDPLLRPVPRVTLPDPGWLRPKFEPELARWKLRANPKQQLFTEAIRESYHLLSTHATPQVMLEIVALEIARGRTVGFAYWDGTAGNSAHAVVATGVTRDPRTTAVRSVVYVDSNHPNGSRSLSREEFLEDVVGIQYVRAVTDEP